MNELTVRYQGDVNIYLQGEEALELTVDNHTLMSYYVGSRKSNILIKDHRQGPAEAAKLALDGVDGEGFADVFNGPGWIEIRSTEDQAEIEIFDGITEKDAPVLWLGVINDGKMTAYDVDWELIKPVDKTKFAFAAVIK